MLGQRNVRGIARAEDGYVRKIFLKGPDTSEVGALRSEVGSIDVRKIAGQTQGVSTGAAPVVEHYTVFEMVE